MDGWELPFGMDRLTEAAADLLQNDTETTREILQEYELGSDPIIDEIIEDASEKLMEALSKELCQSLPYLQHLPSRLVLCGSGANKIVLKSAKKAFGMKKARIGMFENLIADCPTDNSACCGALALIRHTLDRENKQLGVAQNKEPGLLDGLLEKLGLSQLF